MRQLILFFSLSFSLGAFGMTEGLSAVHTAVPATLPERLSARPQVASHRGGGLSSAGNTMFQFQQALRDGADIIETDLRLTKDGVVVVFHDEVMNKSTRCSGALKDYTYAALSKCKFKKNNEKIPTFDELLTWSVGRVVVNAEFKAPSVVVPAIQVMQRHQALEWVYFQTQESVSNYETARRTDANVNLLFFAGDMKTLSWAMSLNDSRLFAIELPAKMHRQEYIDWIHDHGKLISSNSFHIAKDGEKSGIAACNVLFDRGIDIAVTDQTADCVRQRE